MAQSPYSMFPLARNNRPIYTKAPFKRMKGKLAELNDKFKENEQHWLSSAEWKLLTDIVAMLEDKRNYDSQRFNAKHLLLVDKLLLWPSETLPPVLDLIRVMALHPSYAGHCEKKLDAVMAILQTAGNGEVHPINGMLTCRIIINLFNRIGDALRAHFGDVIGQLLPNMMVKEKKNTRIAFVRVLLHFSYSFYVATYHQSEHTDLYKAEKLRCLSLLTEILTRESEPEITLNILMGIGTLLFRDENTIQFANALELKMLLQSFRAKHRVQKDIVKCCDELIEAMEHPEN